MEKKIPHFIKPKNKKGHYVKNIHSETVLFRFRIGSGEGSYPTSVTLRKNIVSLWIVLMDKVDSDPHEVVLEFIENVCLKRWRGESAKGMSDFVLKCMIHSMLEKDDFEAFKKVYLSL
jgi:hypothetical protein